MTSFFAIQHYSSILTLLVGLGTFFGCRAMGSLILVRLRLDIPTPWRQVSEILLGIMTLSLIIQVLGFAKIASPMVLRPIGWGFLGLGTYSCYEMLRSVLKTKLRLPKITGLTTIVFLSVIFIAAFTNLLVAIAPSSKIDEIYYHMLVPGRIVIDHMLVFYREPLVAAIWPQMLYQIALVPTHSINYPDAGNVISWCLSLTLVWFSVQLILQKTKSIAWSLIWASTCIVGLYTAVWHVTGGAHAMGDLAVAAAILCYLDRKSLLLKMSARSLAFVFAIFSVSAISTKISLYPMFAILTPLMVFELFRNVRGVGQTKISSILVMMLLPCLVFIGPLMIWTFVKSGSPLGPVLIDVFSPSLYDSTYVKAEVVANFEANKRPLFTFLYDTAIRLSPLVWIGVASFFIFTKNLLDRLVVGLLFAGQLVLIMLVLPHDVRFLGGIQYAMVINAACLIPEDLKNKILSKQVAQVFMAALVLPWLGSHLYYARQFFPVSTGLIHQDEFLKRYIALYDDYRNLDRLLPEDAVFLVKKSRISASYAPRPVFMDETDLPADKKAYVLEIGGDVADFPLDGKYSRGSEIYSSKNSIIVTYRTPGRLPDIGKVSVSLLHVEK